MRPFGWPRGVASWRLAPPSGSILRIQDDGEMVYGQIPKELFDKYAQKVIDRGRHGKALYAFKGSIHAFSGFEIFKVEIVRYLGDLEKGADFT